MLPRPFRVIGTHLDTRDTVTLALEPLDGVPLAHRRRAVHDAARLRRRRGADLDQRRPDPARSADAHDPRRRRRHPRAGHRERPATSVGVRGPFGTGWDVADGAGGDVVVVAGGIGLAPLRPASCEVVADRRASTAGWCCSTARARRRTSCSPRTWRRGPSAHDIVVEVTVDYGPPSWTGRVGLVTKLVTRAGSTRPHAGAGLRARGDDALRRHGAGGPRRAARSGSGCRWSAT